MTLHITWWGILAAIGALTVTSIVIYLIVAIVVAIIFSRGMR